jgi:hypothetical protein
VYEPPNDNMGSALNGYQPTVAFYDSSQDPEDFPYPGQFTGGRYFVDTLMEHRGGLSLYGGVHEWYLSEMNVLDTKAWLLTMD